MTKQIFISHFFIHKYFFPLSFFSLLIYRIWCLYCFSYSVSIEIWNAFIKQKSIQLIWSYFINGHKVLTRRLISYGFKRIYQLSFKHSCHINSWLFPFDSAKPNRIGLSVTSLYEIESIKKGITWNKRMKKRQKRPVILLNNIILLFLFQFIQYSNVLAIQKYIAIPLYNVKCV